MEDKPLKLTCIHPALPAIIVGFLIVGTIAGQLQDGVTISVVGTIGYRGYICGNYNSTHYYAENGYTGLYELLSTNAASTISYALSKLTPTRTWQEAVLLRGNFSIGTTIRLSQRNVLLDCREATLTSIANTVLLDVHPTSPTSLNNTILGGSWKGLDAGGTINTAIRFMGASNCTIEGATLYDFSGAMTGAILCGYASSHITIRNCSFHDLFDNYGVNLINSGYNKIIDCDFHDLAAGVFVSRDCPRNQVLECAFYGWHMATGNVSASGGHAIYLDGGDGSVGENTVIGCSFYEPLGGAGILVKCQKNSIRGNSFYNFGALGAVGLSIYSQYSPCYANDNDIFDNVFSDMVYAIWFGNYAALSPTLRNRIHENIFTNIARCITLNHDMSTQNIDDTWIYYNSFIDCSVEFPRSSSPPTQIHNTVVAYNTFSHTVTDLSIEEYVNTMVYGNVGMADFNVPTVKPILPPQ